MYYMYIVIKYKNSVATTPFTRFRYSMNLTDLHEICYITLRDSLRTRTRKHTLSFRIISRQDHQ